MKIEFNKLCRRCKKDCKQFASAKILVCPRFEEQEPRNHTNSGKKK